GGNAETEQGAQEKVDAVEVGGRNLLLDSDVTYQNADYLMHTYDFSKVPDDGTTVTVSLKADIGGDRRRFNLYDNQGGSVGHIDDPEDKSNGVYSTTFEWNARANTSGLRLYQYPPSGTTSSKVYWIQLEKGNKATDWTPAPEDQQQAWEQEAESARDKARNDLAERLGYTDYAAFSSDTLQETLITNSGITTGLIDAQAVLANVGTFTDSLKIGSNAHVLDGANNTVSLSGGIFTANPNSVDLANWKAEGNEFKSFVSNNGIVLDSSNPSIGMYSGGTALADRKVTMAPNIGVQTISASDQIFSESFYDTSDLVVSVSSGANSANTPDVSLTSGSRSSEYPIVVELDLQLQNFSDVDSLNGHQVTIELIGVDGTAVETIKVLHDVTIPTHYNVVLTDVFTVGPEDAGVVKYDKVRLKIRGVARSDSFDIHVRNLTFKQFETKTTVNDKGVFLAVSPDIIRTMSGSGSSVVFDGGGTGPSVTDWDNIQNNPFSNNTPSDFADAAHNHDGRYYTKSETIPKTGGDFTGDVNISSGSSLRTFGVKRMASGTTYKS